MYGSTHVWLDHNTFTDGTHPDSAAPTYFGMAVAEFRRSDGQVE